MSDDVQLAAFVDQCRVLKGRDMGLKDAAPLLGLAVRTVQARLKKKGLFWNNLTPLVEPTETASGCDPEAAPEVTHHPDSPSPPQPSRRRGPNTAAPAHIPQSEHLSEEFLEQYLIYLAQHGDPSPQIASQIASFLDKKKMLQPAQELDESNHYLTEFEDIQNAVFTPDSAPDCVPIDSEP